MTNKGFTLFELLIAAVILFLALILALEASSNLNQSNELAHQSVTALQDAHRAVEAMRNASTQGNFPANVTTQFPAGQAIAGFTTLTNEQVVPTYADPNADPLTVTVTVTWDSVTKTTGTRTQQTQLVTLMTRRQ